MLQTKFDLVSMDTSDIDSPESTEIVCSGDPVDFKFGIDLQK